MLNALEKKIISAIQGDIPVSERPFEDLARKAGVSEEEFLQALSGLCKQGVVRRFGATIRHQMSGFTANAMVAWRVEDSRADAVGELFARFPGVTHCYRRPPADSWPYNLYTMVHGKNENACKRLAQTMSQKAGVSEFGLLFSRRELKKTSMKYFASDEDD